MFRTARGATAGAVILSLAGLTGCAPADTGEGAAGGQAAAKVSFTADGQLERPTGYREWVYVGTPLTPNSLNPPEAPFPEFHNVYIHPADFAEYKQTGSFPDGTVLVKELVSVGSEQAVSGNGFFMGEFVGLEATIKDAERFADEPGNWAYFSFGHAYPLADQAEAFPTAACNSCHETSAAEDFVFTQYYPVLRAARGGPMAASGETMEAGDEAFEAISATMMGATEVVMEANAPAATVESVVPTDNAALFEYLSSGAYREFAAQESAPHPSRGPHTQVGLPVQVYLDASLDASMQAGGPHPAGAAAVKEMFDADGQLAGWAVMVKTQDDSDGGNGWFWYELASTEAGVTPVASGNGVPLCFGCHGTGQDFVLSAYPFP